MSDLIEAEDDDNKSIAADVSALYYLSYFIHFINLHLFHNSTDYASHADRFLPTICVSLLAISQAPDI